MSDRSSIQSAPRRSKRPSSVEEFSPLHEQADIDLDRCDIVLRQLTEGDAFSRTIKCRPGSITVIPSGKGAEAYDPFRVALHGRKVEPEVTIRIGSHRVHPSEIHTVNGAEAIRPGMTVEDVLHTVGVPEDSFRDLVDSLGLDIWLEELTERIPSQIVARLAITCALYSRSRIVYVDTPFNDVGSEWAPALANFMLQSVSGTTRVLIVTGVETIPRLWKASPFVDYAGLQTTEWQESTEIIEETMGYLKKIRHLLGTAYNPEDTIVTYPQRIIRQRTPSGSLLMTEAIENPHLAEEEKTPPPAKKLTEKQMERLAKRRAEIRATQKKRRDRSGTADLTKVRKRLRMRNSGVVRLFRQALVQREAVLPTEGGTTLSNYRVKKKLGEQTRRRQHELMLFLLIVTMVGMLLLRFFA